MVLRLFRFDTNDKTLTNNFLKVQFQRSAARRLANMANDKCRPNEKLHASDLATFDIKCVV